ncbi:MAG TPA: hypothetical protein V6C97_12505 [Oculatellaceae cyanobacterium]
MPNEFASPCERPSYSSRTAPIDHMHHEATTGAYGPRHKHEHHDVRQHDGHHEHAKSHEHSARHKTGVHSEQPAAGAHSKEHLHIPPTGVAKYDEACKAQSKAPSFSNFQKAITGSTDTPNTGKTNTDGKDNGPVLENTDGKGHERLIKGGTNL